MKREKVFLLAMVVTVSLISHAFTGCSSEKSDSVQSAKTQPTTDSNSTQSVEKVSVQKSPVVIFTKESRESDAVAAAEVKAYIEEKSGVKFEIEHIKNVADYDTRVNIALASKENIDVINVQNTFTAMVERGALLKLNEYLDKFGSNLKEKYSEDGIWSCVTDKDGNIYGIPRKADTVGSLPSIRKDWREKLGIAPITTFEDFKNYLKAVKNADPGGTNAYPLVTPGGGYVITDLCFSYIFTGVTPGDYKIANQGNYIDENGKVTPHILHPNYKNFLQKMAEWHKTGLMHPELLTMKTEQFNDLIIANRV